MGRICIKRILICCCWIWSVSITEAQVYVKVGVDFSNKQPKEQLLYLGNCYNLNLNFEKKIKLNKSISLGLMYKSYVVKSADGGVGSLNYWSATDFITYTRNYYSNDLLLFSDVTDNVQVLHYQSIGLPITLKYFVTKNIAVSYRFTYLHTLKEPMFKGDKYETPIEQHAYQAHQLENALQVQYTLMGKLDITLGYSIGLLPFIKKGEYDYIFMNYLDFKPNYFYVGLAYSIARLKTKKL